MFKILKFVLEVKQTKILVKYHIFYFLIKKGDSGGPLLIETNNQITQIAVVSYGVGCGYSGIYGVYERVANHRDFLVPYAGAVSNKDYCSAFVVVLVALFVL